MKRRDFFKLFGKAAVASGLAATVGLPEVPILDTNKDIPVHPYYIEPSYFEPGNYTDANLGNVPQNKKSDWL